MIAKMTIINKFSIKIKPFNLLFNYQLENTTRLFCVNSRFKLHCLNTLLTSLYRIPSFGYAAPQVKIRLWTMHHSTYRPCFSIVSFERML
ncbi:hypothetical protein BpHYR1_042487 [Brachionus plicatilis]|uniref:Uncharacterized protein n=1 Tax=Brachionus plicatilis TaxID=10195 RepID=A0A3M7SX80_BRAPC|nr:hypothetical protein BpHYR1_042487 [Brachionus plicatilis]